MTTRRSPSPWRPLRLAVATASVALLAIAAEPAAEDPLARALAEQQERAAANPSDADVQNDLGNLLALAGDATAATAAYRQALADDPKSATAHYNLGLLLLDQGRGRKARSEFLQALSIDPDFANADYYLGVVYSRWHRLRRARGYYSRAFQLDPRLADPDRNPNVVGNRQALAAQLLDWQREVPPGPSRVYAQVRTIAKQADLVAPPAAQPTEPAPAAKTPQPPASLAPSAENGGYARSYNAPPRPAEARSKDEVQAMESPPPPPQVLDASSLDSGTVNQAQPPGVRSRTPRRGRPYMAPGMASGARGGGLPAPADSTRSNAMPAPSYVIPGGAYQASARSTGQIDSSLVPVDATRFAVGG